jgi:hypothetical protein
MLRPRRREKVCRYRVAYWDIDHPEKVSYSPWFETKWEAEDRRREIEGILHRFVVRGYGIRIEEKCERR